MQKIWSIQTDAALVGMPVSIDGMVVCSSASGEVTALSLADGSLLWKQHLAATRLGVTPPTLTHQHVFCGSEAKVCCLDRASGAILWSTAVGEVCTEVIPHGESVFAGTSVGTMYAIDAASGRIKWSLPTKRDSVCSEISRRPAIAKNRIVFGSNNYCVYCASLETGKIVWTFESQFWVQTSPCIVQETVYVASHTSMCALNLSDGARLWEFARTRGEIVGSAATDDVLVFSDSLDSIYCVDRHNGAERWRQQFTEAAVFDPTICGGKVFVPARDDHVYRIDLPTGQIEASVPAEDPSSCALVDDKVLFNNSEGYRSGGRLDCYTSGVNGPSDWPPPRRNAESTSSV